MENPIKEQEALWIRVLEQNTQDSLLATQKIQQFQKIFLQANQEINLTSPLGAVDFPVVHLLDALCALPHFPETKEQVLDIGSGGGVPAIPLAIARPDLSFSLIEATQKKARFLQYAVDFLQLANVKIYNARIEDWSNDPARHKKYDLIMGRAFGKADLILDLTLPLLCIPGKYFLWKTADTAELAVLKKYLVQLGDNSLEVVPTLFREELGQRGFWLIQINGPVPFEKKNYAQLKKKSALRYAKK